MNRILLLGKDGQLGWELARMLPRLGELRAMGRSETDLSNLSNLKELVRNLQPDLIVNAAAYTNVDSAESEQETAMTVNGTAPGVLAQEARRLGALLVHFSTDYVFDGMSRSPYVETDPPKPVNAYGRSKLAGEEAVQQAGGQYVVFRSSWVYSLRRESFVTKLLHWTEDRKRLRIVDDQWGSPTWCHTLADATVHALGRLGEGSTGDQYGLFHLVCRGAASRYDLAQAVLTETGMDSSTVIEPAKSSEFPLPAQRPRFSALDTSRFEKTFQYQIPSWRECLAAALVNETS